MTDSERIIRFVRRRPRKFREIQLFYYGLRERDKPFHRGWGADFISKLVDAGWFRKEQSGLWKYYGQPIEPPFTVRRLGNGERFLARRDMVSYARWVASLDTDRFRSPQ